MKKHLIFISVLLISFVSSYHLKANDDDSIKTLLFSQFETGYVVLKQDYAQLLGLFNYDLIDEKMLYLELDDSICELDASAIVRVVIGNYSFVPAKNKAFYQRVETGNNEFFICYKTKLLSKGKYSGYGGYSQTASVKGFAVSTNAGRTYLLVPDEKIDGIDESAVYLKNGKKYIKINSLKTLQKYFKTHQAEIEAYSKENKTNFNKLREVVSIIKFAFSL